MEEKYLEQIGKIIEENDEIFSSEISSLKVSDFLKLQKAIYTIRKINFDFKLQKVEKEFYYSVKAIDKLSKAIKSSCNFTEPKLTVNKSDKVFEHIDNDFIEVNGVKISNEIFELGYFVSVDKGKISIFKK